MHYINFEMTILSLISSFQTDPPLLKLGLCESHTIEVSLLQYF